MMMLNKSPSITQRYKIAAKGLLIGLGIGLQMCDSIDLSGDATALHGWGFAIVICTFVGTIIGFVKATDSTRFATPTLRFWLLVLSLCMFNPSVILYLYAEPNPYLMGWCKAMIACGVVYATLGIAMWIREYKLAKVAQQ